MTDTKLIHVPGARGCVLLATKVLPRWDATEAMLDTHDAAFSLTLPWPPKFCHPNASSNPHDRSAARRAYRMTGLGASLTSDALPGRPGTPLGCLLTFNPPDRRRRDLDNLVAACKGAIDGVFEGCERDDHDIRLMCSTWGVVHQGGEPEVVLTLWRLDRDTL